MKASERLEAHRQLANNDVTRADSLKYDVINGEWESDHNYMCSACGALYDELREVMHHKWEAHPYALVAHISLREEQQVTSCTLHNYYYWHSLKKPSLTPFGCIEVTSNPLD